MVKERFVDIHNLKREVYDLREQLAKEGLSKDEIDSIIENASLSNFYAYRNTYLYPWHLCFSYYNYKESRTTSVEIAVIDDIENDDSWICKILGKYLWEVFGEKDMELDFNIYNTFAACSKEEKTRALDYIACNLFSCIKIADSRYRSLALLSYNKGICGGKVILPFGSYKYRLAAREKVEEMREQFKAYYESVKNA